MAGYGIVGCGYSGGIHGDGITQLPLGKLVSVYDIDESRMRGFATERGGETADSLEALCSNENVDAVIVTTPNCDHVKPVLCALSHGKHVLCEKPVSLSVEDTRTMVELARDKNRILFAGHTSNFIKGVEITKALLKDGRIGRLLMIEAVHTDWAGPQAVVGWKQKKALSGGHLYHHMHEVELICQLAGLPRSVFAQGGNLAHRGAGFGDEEDALMLQMELSGGGYASLTIGSAFHIGEHAIKLQGDRGGILLDFKNSFVKLITESEESCYGLQETIAEDEERKNGYRKLKNDAGKGFGRPGMKTSMWMSTIFRKELECFDHLIGTGEIEPQYESLADGSAAINCLKVLDGARLSQEEKRLVLMEEM